MKPALSQILTYVESERNYLQACDARWANLQQMLINLDQQTEPTFDPAASPTSSAPPDTFAPTSSAPPDTFAPTSSAPPDTSAPTSTL